MLARTRDWADGQLAWKDAEAAKAKRKQFPDALSHIREVCPKWREWREWLEIAGEPQPRPLYLSTFDQGIPYDISNHRCFRMMLITRRYSMRRVPDT